MSCGRIGMRTQDRLLVLRSKFTQALNQSFQIMNRTSYLRRCMMVESHTHQLRSMIYQFCFTLKPISFDFLGPHSISSCSDSYKLNLYMFQDVPSGFHGVLNQSLLTSFVQTDSLAYTVNATRHLILTYGIFNVSPSQFLLDVLNHPTTKS